jgi:hypothetical protein
MCEALREIMADDLKEVEIKTKRNISTVATWLYDLKRDEDVKKALCDQAFMDELFEEYNSCHEEKIQ